MLWAWDTPLCLLIQEMEKRILRLSLSDKIFFLNQGNRKEFFLIILLSCWHVNVLPEYNRV